MAGMTVQEAAEVLGIAPDSDKKAVDAAARELIRKWHPDKWRNASPGEQQKASEEFMRVTKAQKVLKNPETAAAPQADAAGSSPSSSTSTTGASRETAAPRPQTQNVNPFEIDVPNQRPRYNTATSFEDAFGQLPDSMETSLSEMFAQEAAMRYRQAADAVRLTLSVIPSVAAFIISFWLFAMSIGIGNMNELVAKGTAGEVLASLFPDGGKPTELTFLIICLVVLAKAVIYDAFISYRIPEKVPAARSSLLVGIESVALGLLGLVLCGGWPAPRAMYGCLMLVGIVITAIHVVMRIVRHSAA